MTPTLALLGLLLSAPSSPPPTPPVVAFAEADRLAPIFAGFEACFVLLDTRAGSLRALGGSCDERSTPASTFKVPHALLALETGVADGPDFRLPWDGRKHAIRSWNRDQDLRSAIENSVVWYFQEIARRIGEERMAAGVAGLGYGNADTGTGLTRFWLGGSLAISPLEQVAFLDRLRLGRLPLSARSQQLVRELIVVGADGEAVLHGKTGTSLDPDIGWFVGWLERDGGAWVFATRIRGEGARGFTTARRMSESALGALGLWRPER